MNLQSEKKNKRNEKREPKNTDNATLSASAFAVSSKSSFETPKNAVFPTMILHLHP